MNAAEDELKRAWDEIVSTGKEPKFEGVKQQAFQALRYDWFGDPFAAREQFQKVRDENKEKAENKEKPENRVWFLLAVKQVEGLKEKAEKKKALKDRQEWVNEKAAEAKLMKPSEQKQRKAICLDLVALYDGQDDFKDPVAQAKAILGVR
jgi:hypothetical protein